jgi:hypothetical protein
MSITCVGGVKKSRNQDVSASVYPGVLFQLLFGLARSAKVISYQPNNQLGVHTSLSRSHIQVASPNDGLLRIHASYVHFKSRIPLFLSVEILPQLFICGQRERKDGRYLQFLASVDNICPDNICFLELEDHYATFAGGRIRMARQCCLNGQWLDLGQDGSSGLLDISAVNSNKDKRR